MDCLILGGHGFVGHHLARRLKADGHFVGTVDIKDYEYGDHNFSDWSVLTDLREPDGIKLALRQGWDRVYQLAADMGGAGYIFTGEHDAEILSSSARINANVINTVRTVPNPPRVFFASSACVYGPDVVDFREDSAYPANPDSDYGWEKLFAERSYLAAMRAGWFDVRIARLHNVFGPEGAWNNGREKAPAAICRKVAASTDGTVKIWGDGSQRRTFLYIDEAVEGIVRIMEGNCHDPINLGAEEDITIDRLARSVVAIAGKEIAILSEPGPTGVRSRRSNNAMIRRTIGWAPDEGSMMPGLQRTYRWIEEQVRDAD